jgi:hypothetical protein
MAARQALTLSELSKTGEAGMHGAMSHDPSRSGAAVGEPQMLLSAMADGSSIAGLGQRRVDSSRFRHCASADGVRWGYASDLARCRCKACSRTFNVLTKTPLGVCA